VSDAAEIQQLVRRAWDEARPIDMGHLNEHDRVLVCETIADLIEAVSPRLKTRTGRRPYIVIVRDHHQLRIELRDPEGWLHSNPPASVPAPDASRPAAPPPRRR
jgi:hypothetical protein